VVATAAEVFSREVPQRSRGVSSGLPRLRALCESWISYLERGVLPGGCFFTAAATEFDGRDGPVRDAVAGLYSRWLRDLRGHVRRAVHHGDLPPDTDPDQLVFEIVGIMLALNHVAQLQADPSAAGRARRAVDRLLRS
jgi:hypothetical protein